MEDQNSVDPNNNGESDEVRTLFVSGLPANVRSREIYLLFRAYKGYEGFQLKLTDKQGKPSPVAFVTFLEREDAEDCKNDLQGVRFDPEVSQALRIDFARTNTKVSKMAYRNGGAKITSPTDGLTP
ncbi:RNA-binding with multiple splicing-like isoform X2, partial [Paramuricea clavata]